MLLKGIILLSVNMKIVFLIWASDSLDEVFFPFILGGKKRYLWRYSIGNPGGQCVLSKMFLKKTLANKTFT